MREVIKVYAWFDRALAGFINVGTKGDRLPYRRNRLLEFNSCAVHFEVHASPASPEYLQQVIAIAQIALVASSSEDFRKRCLKDVSVIQEVETIVPIEVLR